MIDIIFVFTFIAWIILAIAMWKNNKWLGFMAGILLVIIGMFALIYGVQSVDNNMTRAYGIIQMVIGLFVMLSAGLEQLEEADN